MTKAVFFDWFNTLAQYYPSREKLHADAYSEVGIELTKEAISRGLLVADQFYIDENTRVPIRKRLPQEQMEFYGQYERVVLKEAGLEISEELVLRIMQKLGGTSAKVDFILFDDVLPTLEMLKQRRLILGLISNIDRDIRPFCEELGLSPYLDIIVTSQEVDSDKPHPPIFLAALKGAGVEASETIYIGDQYNLDIVGARGVGMKAVLIDRYDLFPEITDCPRIKTLGEVTERL
jgi:putative hydrolase of the HAD superfamily